MRVLHIGGMRAVTGTSPTAYGGMLQSCALDTWMRDATAPMRLDLLPTLDDAATCRQDCRLRRPSHGHDLEWPLCAPRRLDPTMAGLILGQILGGTVLAAPGDVMDGGTNTYRPMIRARIDSTMVRALQGLVTLENLIGIGGQPTRTLPMTNVHATSCAPGA